MPLDPSEQYLYEQLISALRDNAAAMGGVRRIQVDTERVEQQLDRVANSGGRAADELDSAANMARAERAVKEREIEAQQQFSRATYEASSSLRQFKDSLLKANPVFGDFGGAITSAGDAALSLGKAAGGAGFVLGALAKAATMMLGAAAKQTDYLLKTSDSLAKIGAVNEFTAKDILRYGHQLRLGADQLAEGFVKPITSMETSVRALGTNTGEAVLRFKDMATTTKEVRAAFRRLGISTFEEMNQTFADFTNMISKSGMGSMASLMTEKELNKASIEYTKNLYTLSALTGKNVDQLKKEQEQLSQIYQAQVVVSSKMQQVSEIEQVITQKKKAGQDTSAEEADLKRLQADISTMQNMALAYKQMGKDEKTIAAEIVRYATGTITTGSERSELVGMGGEKDKLYARGRAGEEIKLEEFMDLEQRTMERAVKQYGGPGGRGPMIYSEDFGKTVMGGGAEAFQAYGNRVLAKSTDIEAGKKVRDKVSDIFNLKGPAGQDIAQGARDKLSEASADVKTALDRVISYFNPFTQGLTVATAAVIGLSIAAGAASAALGLSGFAGMLRSGMGMPGRGPMPGPTPGAPIPGGGGVPGGGGAPPPPGGGGGGMIANARGAASAAAQAGKGAIPGAAVVSTVLAGVNYYSAASEIERQKEAGAITERQESEQKASARSVAAGQAAGGTLGYAGGVALGTFLAGLLGVGTGGLGAVAAPAIIQGLGMVGAWLGGWGGGAAAKAGWDWASSDDYDEDIQDLNDDILEAMEDKDVETVKEKTKELLSLVKELSERDDIKISPETSKLLADNYQIELPPDKIVDPNAPKPKEIDQEEAEEMATPQMDKGGVIGVGETAIVGEKGPELIQGPGTVTGRQQTTDIIRTAMQDQFANMQNFTPNSSIRDMENLNNLTVDMKNQFTDIQRFVSTSPMLGLANQSARLREEKNLKDTEIENLSNLNENTELLNDSIINVLKTFYKFDDAIKEVVGNEEQSTGLFSLIPDPFGVIGGMRRSVNRAFGNTGGGKLGPTDVKSAVESEEGKEAYEFFKSKGYTDAVSAGLVANLMKESGSNLKTDAVGDSGKAYGIAQWHPDRQALFAQKFGKDIRESTLQEQLEFVDYELKTTESAAGASLAGVEDPQLAAALIDKKYERSAGLTRGSRMQLAQAIMDARRYESTVLPSTPSETTTTTASTGEVVEKIKEEKEAAPPPPAPAAPVATASVSPETLQMMNLNAQMMEELNSKLNAMVTRLDEANTNLNKIRMQTA